MKFYFQCPRCSNDEEFIKPQEQASNLGWALFFFGGFLPALLYADHSSHRVQCKVCGTMFRQPPLPSSPVGKFAHWILGSTIVLSVVAVFFFMLPNLAAFLPSLPVIDTFEQAISAHPRVAAYFLTLLCLLTAASCWIAAYFSNSKFRMQLSKEVRLDPLVDPVLSQQSRSLPDTSVGNRTA